MIIKCQIDILFIEFFETEFEIKRQNKLHIYWLGI